MFQRFATVMALYLCFLVGFTIAFSIIFPEVTNGSVLIEIMSLKTIEVHVIIGLLQEKFVSYPRSFFRTFAMMTGELNFDDVFDPEESRPFEFAALAIYLGFTIIVTIVIVNLLVGLTVDDVAVSLCTYSHSYSWLAKLIPVTHFFGLAYRKFSRKRMLFIARSKLNACTRWNTCCTDFARTFT